MVSNVDTEAAEAGGEFVEAENLVSVLVELAEQVDNVVLEAGEVLGGVGDLGHDLLKAGLRENFGVVLHIFSGVLVDGHEHKFEAGKIASATDHEVALSVVLSGHGVLLLLALNEGSSNAARVLIAHLVDVDGVVTAVERDDESARLIIGLGGYQASVETQNVHVLLEHLLHVILGGLGLEGNN